jgi:hypothetical protein
LKRTLKTISTEEFNQRTKEDPGWAQKLTEPLEVWGDGQLDKSLTHLSPLLHFVKGGWFEGFENLRRAEGKFEERVSFISCGLEEIGDLQAQDEKWSLTIRSCHRLKAMHGAYPGFVSVTICDGLEEIRDFESMSEGSEERGSGDLFGLRHGALFGLCPNLKVAQGKFKKCPSFLSSGIEKIGDLQIEEPQSTGLWLDLAGTTLAERNPREAMRLMERFPLAIMGSPEKGKTLPVNMAFWEKMLGHWRTMPDGFDNVDWLEKTLQKIRKEEFVQSIRPSQGGKPAPEGFEI